MDKFFANLPYYKCPVCKCFVQVLVCGDGGQYINQVDAKKTTELYKKHLATHKEDQQ